MTIQLIYYYATQNII